MIIGSSMWRPSACWTFSFVPCRTGHSSIPSHHELHPLTHWMMALDIAYIINRFLHLPSCPSLWFGPLMEFVGVVKVVLGHLQLGGRDVVLARWCLLLEIVEPNFVTWVILQPYPACRFITNMWQVWIQWCVSRLILPAWISLWHNDGGVFCHVLSISHCH